MACVLVVIIGNQVGNLAFSIFHLVEVCVLFTAVACQSSGQNFGSSFHAYRRNFFITVKCVLTSDALYLQVAILVISILRSQYT